MFFKHLGATCAVRRALTAFVIFLVSGTSTAATAYVELGNLPAPVAPVSIVYSAAAHTLALLGQDGTIVTIDTNSRLTATHSANSRFTDIHPSPSGKYLFAADFGGVDASNTYYTAPLNSSYVHRLDMTTGTWEQRKAYIAYRVLPTADDQFVLTSGGQSETYTFNGWDGTWGWSTILNSITNPIPADPGYKADASGSDIFYDPNSGRILAGDTYDPDIQAILLVDNNFQRQEFSLANTSRPHALASDGSAFYVRADQYNTQNLQAVVRTFPEPIYAAYGDVAFGAGAFYDAHTTQQLGTLGVQSSLYGLDPQTSDFWLYDANAGLLRHYGSARITLSAVTPTAVGGATVTAAIVPSQTDTGSTASVWMGASYGNSFFLRDGTSWVIYGSGPLPVAMPSVTLISPTQLTVTDQVDISQFPGLAIYVGYGTSAQDMLSSPGKVSRVYTVPNPPISGISLSPASVPIGGRATIAPQPSTASLGTCTSLDTSVATVDGGSATGVKPGTAKISCNNRTAVLTVQVPPLTGISLQPASFSVGDTATIVPVPQSAQLGVCVSSDTSLATISGTTVTAVGGGSVTITCNGTQSLTVLIKGLNCHQEEIGKYNGTVSGGYTGTVSLDIEPLFSGQPLSVQGAATIDGLGTIAISGQMVLPRLTMVAYCGANVCLNATGTVSNGMLTGSYSTSTGQSGTFSLAHTCSN